MEVNLNGDENHDWQIGKYIQYVYIYTFKYLHLSIHHVSKFYLRMLERVKVMLIN